MKEAVAEKLRRELDRLQFDYREEETEVKLLERIEDIHFGGVLIEGGKKGHLLRLPLYLAECLVTEGKAEWTESPTVDISHLYSLLSREQEQPAIQSLSKFAHVRIAHQLQKLQEKTIDPSSELRHSERDNILSGFRRFLTNRTHKIMRMASHRSHRAVASKTLTAYELVLFDLITIVVKEWENSLLNPASDEPRDGSGDWTS